LRIDTKEVVRGTLTFVGGDDGSTEYSMQVEAMVSWNMPGMDFILGLPLVVTYSLLSTLLDHLSDGTIACLQWCYFSSLALVCSL